MTRPKTIGASLPILALLVGAFSSCGSSNHASTATSTTIAAPSYTAAQEDTYFQDLAKSVPTLSPYVTSHGKAALDALLAYGAGFCVLLKDGYDPDAAVNNLQDQAASLQSKTGFSGNETDFETFATDSLIALCPAEQSDLTQPELAQLREIEQTLAGK